MNITISPSLAQFKIAVRFAQCSFCVVLLCFGCSGTDPSTSSELSDDGVDIKLQVEGITDGYGYFGGMLGETYFTTDSFPFDAKGRTHIVKTTKLPEGLYYMILPGRVGTLQFLLTDDQKFSLKTNLQNPAGEMLVEDSEENTLLYDNLKFEQNYQPRYGTIRNRLNAAAPGSSELATAQAQARALVAERKAHLDGFAKNHPEMFFTKFKLAGQNPPREEPRLPNGEIDEQMQVYLYRKAYWDNVDFTDGRLLRTPVYHNKLKTYIEQLIPQRADSLIKYADWITRQSMGHDSLFKYTANFIGRKYKEPSFMGADAVYVHMVKNFFTNDLAFWSNEYELKHLQQDAQIRSLSLPGKKAQDITVQEYQGGQISLYDLKAPLKVLYIYTTECENCQKETPLVMDVYREWRSRGVEILALCTDQEESAWRNYVQKNGLTWHNGFDPENKSDYQYKWHMDITPEIYVINKDFEIVAKDLKAFQLPEVFARELAKG